MPSTMPADVDPMWLKLTPHILSFLTIVITIIGFMIVARLNRKQSFVELRSNNLIRVYEDLIGAITVFLQEGQNADDKFFNAMLNVYAKINIAKMPSTDKAMPILDEVSKKIGTIYTSRISTKTDDRKASVEHAKELMTELMYKLRKCLDDQLGKDYKQSYKK